MGGAVEDQLAARWGCCSRSACDNPPPPGPAHGQASPAHLSCPAASRLTSGWAVRIQKRSCSRRNVCSVGTVQGRAQGCRDGSGGTGGQRAETAGVPSPCSLHGRRRHANCPTRPSSAADATTCTHSRSPAHLHPDALGHVPHPQRLVLAVGHNQVLRGVWVGRGRGGRSAGQSRGAGQGGVGQREGVAGTAEREHRRCVLDLRAQGGGGKAPPPPPARAAAAAASRCRPAAKEGQQPGQQPGQPACLGWKMTHDTLLTWPRSVSTSHALVSAVGSRGCQLGWVS